MQEPQVREQVDDLLLAEVPAPGRAVRAQPGSAQLLLVPLRVGAGGEEEHDLARLRVAVVDELLDALRDVLRLGAPPVHVGARVRRLVGDEQLDRRAEDRVGELARRVQRLELVAELAGEELVDDGEHLRPRAVVLRQRQHLRRRRAALAEDLHVRVPEAVDRLELVADEEHLRRAGAARRVDQLALQAVRVLELVDHDRAEAQLLALAHVVVRAQQVARAQLEILEVEHRLAVLRGLVLLGEAVQQLLQELAVARRDLVERGLLDPAARLVVRRRALAARLQARRGRAGARAFGLRSARPGAPAGRRARCASVARLVVGEAARRVLEARECVDQARPLAELEHELTPGGAQRLVDARQHPPQARRAVGREQPQPFRLAA